MPNALRRKLFPIINFVCPRELKDQLAEIAAREHSHMSTIIRRACAAEIERVKLTREREERVYGRSA